jgi:hypothetical protein
MRAKLFFSVLGHGRKMFERRHNMTMLDLCDVSTAASSSKNFESVRKHFIDRINPRKRRVYDTKDIRTAHVMAGMMRSVLPKGVVSGR